jgi:hypothetical protein
MKMELKWLIDLTQSRLCFIYIYSIRYKKIQIVYFFSVEKDIASQFDI